MKKALVVYFTTSGNTEMLAKSLTKGLEAENVAVTLKNVSDAHDEAVADYDLVALGCPAQGDEELDDTEFAPYFESIQDQLKDKPLALFGSFGWGDGQYMETWKETCESVGAKIVSEPLTVLETPDQDALDKAENLGKALAGA